MIIKLRSSNGDIFHVDVDINENKWDVNVKVLEGADEDKEIVLYQGQVDDSALENNVSTSAEVKDYCVTLSRKVDSNSDLNNKSTQSIQEEHETTQTIEAPMPAPRKRQMSSTGLESNSLREKRVKQTAPEAPEQKFKAGESTEMASTAPERVTQMSENLPEDRLSAGDNGDVALSNQTHMYGTNPLAFLKSDPYFKRMLPLLQENPTYLSPTLEYLCGIYPTLIHILRDNQDELVRIIVTGDVDNSETVKEE